MPERSRRALLASLGAAAVAGCLDGGGDATATGTDEPTRTGTPTRTDTPTATETATPEPPDSIETDWPAPAHDPGVSNGTAAAAGPTTRPAELWAVDLGAALSAPVVADGTVYVGGDGTVHALDARTGDRRWEQSVDGTAGDPWVRDGRVFVPLDGSVAALDRADGTVVWTEETPDRAAFLVAPSGPYWLAGGDSPAVVALADDGTERWRTDIADPWEPPLFAGAGSVFVSSGSYDSRFWVLDPDDGTVTDDRPRSGADFPTEQYYRDGTVYAVDAFFGNVRTTPMTEDGHEWSQGVPPGGRLGVMSGGADRAYYASGIDGEPSVTAMDATDGTVAWTATPDPPVTGRPVAAASVVLVPTDDGLRAFEPTDGAALWSLDAGGEGIAVVDDLLYAADGGTLRAYRPP
jgi:outer membrane protein assembly factor BamB